MAPTSWRNPERLASSLGLWSSGDGPLYRQLADAIDHLIAVGAIAPGEVLPPERALSNELDVARGTVVRAYAVLTERHQVERVQGSGTRVADRTAASSDRPSARPSRRELVSDPLFSPSHAAIDLRVAVPDVLPTVLDVLDSVDLRAHIDVLDDDEPAGIPALRDRIARHHTDRGLPTTPQEILITAGAQSGIALCAALLTQPGDVALREETSWPGFIDAVARQGGRTQGVDSDDDGIVPDALERAIVRHRPALVALNPHHHNPTGSRLSPERRRRVAQLGADFGLPIVEDRVLAPLAFDRQPPPLPLAAEITGSDRRTDHFIVDSVNKVAWPGLRLGWIRADPAAISQLRSLRATVDLYSPIHSQLAALALLDRYDELAAERVLQLRARAELLVDGLRAEIPEWDVRRPRGGLVLWIRLPEGSAAGFCEHAARYGVLIAHGEQFGSSDDTHVRIAFTDPPESIEQAVPRLAAAWQYFDTSRDRPLAATRRA